MLEMLHGMVERGDKLGVPGPYILVGGNENAGFYGETSTNTFITGDALAAVIGLTTGIAQNSTISWLKFNLDGKILFIAKNSFRYSISYNHINAVNAVYGDKTIVILGETYKVRLIKGANTDPTTAVTNSHDDPQTHASEWNRLMYPICIENPSYPKTSQVGPNWANYTEDELNVVSSGYNGLAILCQEKLSDKAIYRGGTSVTTLRDIALTSHGPGLGWRPCLELVP